MIPTTVTSSSTSPATAAGSNNNNSIGGSSSNSSNVQQNSSTLMIGIASLILEGRAIADDEYHQPLQCTAASGSVYTSTGQQSPKPSTSRAATCATGSTSSGQVINITTNPQAFHHYGPPLYIDSSSACSSAESTRQRLSQKLCQLRQASPTVSFSAIYEPTQNATAVESELVALALDSAIDDLEIRHRVMLHRANPSSLAASGGSGSASSSPGSGSENFLHSLQSLATTCLRGGSPPMEHNNSYRYPTLCASPVSPPILAAASPKYTSYRATPPRSHIPYSLDMPGSGSSNGSGIQSPRANWSTPTTSFGVAAGAATSSTVKEAFERQVMRRMHLPTSATLFSSLATAAVVASNAIEVTTKGVSVVASTSSTYPQQGPHCDQFLRKMGLAKGEAAEAEDHICDMSYVNITCSRWRAHCLKMEAIMARGEPICIEVYLGPVGHKILLEQWIITQKEKVPPPTMTLPSLCSAIRSQLYFSQISAWCDLIKKSDKAIYDTGRIIFPTPTGAAGDLATSTSSACSQNTGGTSSSGTTPGTSPSSATASPLQSHQLTMHSMLNRRPRLNIFYRIKQYDSTACFNSKPNVHNFPNVNITENCSISVCLKSLPRINGGIPKIGTGMSTSGEVFTANGISPNSSNNGNTNGAACTTSTALDTPKTSRSSVASPPPNCDSKKAHAATTPTTTPAIVNTATAAVATVAAALVTTAAATAPTVTASSTNGTGGKYKSIFFIDEEELLDANFCADAGDDDDSISDTTTSGAGFDSSNSSFSSNANLSHRERQLLKYRKRMLKRDKKHHLKPLCNASDASCEMAGAELQQQQQRRREPSNGEQPATTCQPMEQSEEETHTSASLVTRGDSVSVMRTTHIEMISTGTQTPLAACCQQCGNEKALVCLKCSIGCGAGAGIVGGGGDCDGLLVKRDDMGSSSSISSTDIIHTPRNKAELLLQAIQRTPKAAKHKKKCLRVTSSANAVEAPVQSQNNNHLNMLTPSQSGAGPSCQVCKRQKTQHNFGTRAAEVSVENAEELVADEDDDEGDGRVSVDECDKSVYEGESTTQLMEEEEEEQEECYNTSTKLTPFIDARLSLSTRTSEASCATANKENDSASHIVRSCTPPLNELVTATAAEQFKTPTNNHQQQKQQQQQQHQKLQPFQHKQTPKPNLLQITCNYQDRAGGDSNYSSMLSYDCFSTTPPAHHNPLLLRKGLPKVNLTPIFCNPGNGATASISSPIPISCPPAASNAFSFDAPATANGTLHASCSAPAVIVIDNNNIPVQKSFSAPTLPNSPSLSPRFAKQAAIYKRRSRHLSDRSDRSSLGSDEQFSDEDLENGMYSPATSPMKNRSRIAAAFGRLPLLGNLEEALLQKRILPKVEVLGFKVLLGASGGFCPTQLTIPAAAFFYELHGETLSTPYLCDIRLPRKGYSVPRAGTVQATLLSPMGTVVRMFVIPYDMRDMPPLHQTFIRQRILAEASVNETITLQASNGVKSATLLNGFGSGEKESASLFNSNNNNNNNNCNNNNGNKSNNNITPNNNSNNNNHKYRVSPSGGLHGESNLGHFISAEHMKRLRYSIHLRFQTSRSGRLSLHTDIRLLISRRTDCDTAAAHAKGALEAPNDLVTDTVMPTNPKYSARQENPSKI